MENTVEFNAEVNKEKTLLRERTTAQLQQLLVACGKEIGHIETLESVTEKHHINLARIKIQAILELLNEARVAENLIILENPMDPRSTRLTRQMPAGLTIDLTAKRWSFRGKTYDIGQTRPARTSGVIGVFDLSQNKDLRLLTLAMRASTTSPNPEYRFGPEDLADD